MGEVLNHKTIGLIFADAANKVFVNNGREFPDFNTMGHEMAKIVLDRQEEIKKNPGLYEKYFEREEVHARKYGGVNMHKAQS